MDRIRFLLAAVLAAGVIHAGCEGKIDDGDGADADADADGDADADADEGCSMNSGAFCTCDHPFDGECDDGTYCLSVLNLGDPGDLGFCSPTCDCESYDEVCQAEQTPYRAVPRCIMARPWPIGDSTRCNCVLMNCDGDEDCPDGQVCHEIVGTQGPYEGVTIYICSPP